MILQYVSSLFPIAQQDKVHTPYMGLQLLQQYVRGNLEQDVRYEEDGQSSVVLCIFDIQIFLQSENCGIADVDSATAHYRGQFKASSEEPRIEDCIPIQKGEQVHDTQYRYDMPVNLGHQLALRSGGERREVCGLGIDLAFTFAIIIICFEDAYVCDERLAVCFPGSDSS
jgi:hypothetical protein